MASSQLHVWDRIVSELYELSSSLMFCDIIWESLACVRFSMIRCDLYRTYTSKQKKHHCWTAVRNTAFLHALHSEPLKNKGLQVCFHEAFPLKTRREGMGPRYGEMEISRDFPVLCGNLWEEFSNLIFGMRRDAMIRDFSIINV